MREVKEGDLVLIDQAICIAQYPYDQKEKLYFMSLESQDFENVTDTQGRDYQFITNLKYLKRSVNPEEIKTAKQILEDNGHDVQYLSDGMYAVNRLTSKPSYVLGAGLIKLAEESKEKQETSFREKQEKNQKAIIKRQKKQEEKEKNGNESTETPVRRKRKSK